MTIFSKISIKHPSYFVPFLPLIMLLCFSACSSKDDFANKPVQVTPNEHVVASPKSNEPPIIILSPNTSNSETYTPTKQKSKSRKHKTLSKGYNASIGNTGNYAVQIGAFSSSSIASKAVKQAQKTAPSFLSSAGTDIDTIQKNGKSLYRVKLTGLNARTAAQACSELKQKQLSCMVTQ